MVTGIRPSPAVYYGAAKGLVNNNTLGVQPFVRYGTGVATFRNLATLTGSVAQID